MSTVPPPDPYPVSVAQLFVDRISPATSSASQVLRRRPTMEQGRALEKLGHAIEYLVDSRLYSRSGLSPLDELNDLGDREAERIMARLSRAVFAECREVTPARQRLKVWLLRWLTGHGAT